MARSLAKVYLEGANEVFSYLPSRRSVMSAALALVSVFALRPRSSGAQTKTINLRNFGLKSIQTTGSMTAGSNLLTLPASAGFAVGDSVIVAAGGEAGKGMRGTAGVGGTWPVKSYGTVSEMISDRSQRLNIYARVTASGDVYQWQDSDWVQNASNQDYGGAYYTNKAIPKALVAEITAIGNGGKNLTLNARASVSTSSANVYYDNQKVLNSVLGDQSMQGDGVNVYVPPGSYAVGDQIQFLRKNNWTLFGDSPDVAVIFSPAGAPSAMFLIEECTNPVVQDISLRGNALQNGFGLQWGPVNQQIGDSYVNQGRAWPSGFLFHDCNGGVAQNLKIYNVFQNAVSGSFTDGLQAINCYCRVDDPVRQYVQWMFICADTTVGCTFTDCTVDSAYLTGGFSGFRSLNVKYIRPVGINASMAMNDVGGFLIQDANLTFTSLSQFDESSFSRYDPIVNINSNIGGEFVAAGGTISGMVINQQGYINATNDDLQGIVVNDSNPNITISGKSYTAPDYAGGGGPYAVNSTGANTVLENFTVYGSNVGSGYPNIGLWGPNPTIVNCTADVIRTSL